MSGPESTSSQPEPLPLGDLSPMPTETKPTPASSGTNDASKGGDFIPGDNIAMFYLFFGIVLIVPYSIFIILISNPAGLGWFAYHPPLMALAFSAAAFGISPLQPVSKPDAVKVALDTHGLFAGFIAAPLLLIGAGFEWQHKDDRGKEHMTSWHGLLGVAAVFWILAQGVMGFLLGGGYVAKKYNRYHRRSGYLLIVLLAAVVLLAGVFSGFTNRNSWTATRWIVYGLGPISVAGGVIGRVRSRKVW
ncbi:hypothetical protein DL93DRAFT_2232578 [Clavulina sp. PMI_390]|nr:hypothetical protein DL93DRAFT_2232578 [Clavulina sp. PMI_390]